MAAMAASAASVKRSPAGDRQNEMLQAVAPPNRNEPQPHDHHVRLKLLRATYQNHKPYCFTGKRLFCKSAKNSALGIGLNLLSVGLRRGCGFPPGTSLPLWPAEGGEARPGSHRTLLLRRSPSCSAHCRTSEPPRPSPAFCEGKRIKCCNSQITNT